MLTAIALLLVAVAGCEPVSTTGGASSGNHGSDALEPSLVRVAAAADLRFALEEIVGELKRAHPGLTVEVTYGSSGQLSTQIIEGAVFDLFLSADRDYADRLIEAARAGDEDRFEYARGQLALFTARGSAWDVPDLALESLRDPAIQKIAIAHPEHAPYGRAAVAALKSVGLWEDVQDRLVLGDNVSQAAQFAASGSADLGIIALSLAMAPAMQEQGRFAPVPPDAHPPLIQTGVVLSRQHAGARALRAALLGEAGQATLKRYGFLAPGSHEDG